MKVHVPCPACDFKRILDSESSVRSVVLQVISHRTAGGSRVQNREMDDGGMRHSRRKVR